MSDWRKDFGEILKTPADHEREQRERDEATKQLIMSTLRDTGLQLSEMLFQASRELAPRTITPPTVESNGDDRHFKLRVGQYSIGFTTDYMNLSIGIFVDDNKVDEIIYNR